MNSVKRQKGENLVYLLDSMRDSTTRSMPKNALNQHEIAPWQCEMKRIAEAQDRHAYQKLYEHFAPKIQAFFSQQGLTDKAEEFTHEVFIKIWRKAKMYDPKKAQVSTWIFTIVRNLRIDYLRKRKLEQVCAADEELTDSATSLEKVTELKRSRTKLLSIFRRLTEEQRNVLQKVYFEDKSHQATADELEMTIGVVKSRVRSAIKVMRSQMGDEQR